MRGYGLNQHLDTPAIPVLDAKIRNFTLTFRRSIILLLLISLSLDYSKNKAKSNKLINSNVKNTTYKYYIRKIVDEIFTSHQNLYKIKSMSKNKYAA